MKLRIVEMGLGHPLRKDRRWPVRGSKHSGHERVCWRDMGKPTPLASFALCAIMQDEIVDTFTSIVEPCRNEFWGDPIRVGQPHPDAHGEV